MPLHSRRDRPGLPDSLETLRQGLLDLLFPPCCLSCQQRLPSLALPLCLNCQRHLERAAPADVQARLERLDAARDVFEHAFALWVFDKNSGLQALQHKLKYENYPKFGLALGRLLGRGYRSAGLPLPSLVLPIPLHRTRQLERGYNQSALLARGMVDVLDASLRTDVLRRSRPTRSQTSLAREARWNNVRRAFVVADPDALPEENVLLVDDVLTTGSTLTAAARALSEHGPHTLSLATLALART